MRKRMMGKLRKMSKTYYLRQIVACMIVYCILLAVPAQVVQADPNPPSTARPSSDLFGITYTATGGGSASWNMVDTTTINAPNGSIFDWQNFDIGNSQSVVHIQGSTDAVLHRINVTTYGDGAATGINGNLSAPGYLFVVNPMGIVIGSEAWITANRFVASGLNISNFDEFIANPANPKVLQFEGYSDGTLGVINNSNNINVAEAVALVGKTVVNNGTITSGSVVLAAGERVYLAVTEGSGNLVVDVTDLSTPTPSDHNVENAGTIDATDGNVLLAAGDIYSNAISGVENLAAKANGNIMFFENIQAGEIVMEAGRDVILAVDKTMDSDGMLTLKAGRDISLLGRVEASGEGDVSLTTTSGNVEVMDVRASEDQITINSGGAILEYIDDPDADLTAATLSLTAKTGITGQSPIETSATDITASTEAGNIDIDNSNGSATTASLAVTTGTGTILFSQAGGGSLYLTSASTADGSIGIDVDNAALTARTVTADGVDVDDNVSLTTLNSGDVIVDNITALGNTITINSRGAIAEYGNGDSAADLTADTLDLVANDVIGTWHPIETAANTIIASTFNPAKTNAHIFLNNDDSSPTSLTASTVGTDSWIEFSQKGGGELTLADVKTVDGLIDISAENGNIMATLVNAGGAGDVELTTIASGDVIVNDVKAIGNTITINSAGVIKGFSVPTIFDPHLTADTLDLTANDGIGWPASDYIQTAANTIIARTVDDTKTSAHIRLINDNSSPTSLTASTVGTDSWVRFSQRGGGELTLTDVTTDNGGIVIEAKEGDIVAKLVNAGGQFGDVYLDTYDSSGDIAVGSVTADGDLINIGSAGAIDNEGAVDGVANAIGGVINLTANSGGIGQNTTLEVTASSELNADTTVDGSNININSIGNLPVGLVDAGTGDVTLDSSGNIMGVTDDTTADVAGSTINLIAAVGGIGDALDVKATTALNADTTADDSDIVIDSIGDLPVGLVDAGTGDVTLDSSGNIMGVTDDTTADIAGSTINLIAAVGGIGDALDVTALTALNADTTADNSDIEIDSIGDLPVGFVDAGTGDVTLDSTAAINDDSDDTEVDIVADMLTLSAVNEIGGPPNPSDSDTLNAIETTVNGLDAQVVSFGDIVIVETDDVELYNIITDAGNIYLEATQGGMTHAPENIIVAGLIEVGNSTLTMVQQDDLDLAGFEFGNQEDTELMVEITAGGFTADDTKAENAADQWWSIQALATGNIVLQGSDAEEDIKIGTHPGFEPQSHPFGGVVESSGGGVSIISENRTVRTADDTILDNVSIAGTSDDELDIGVDLPYGPGKAAIVIMGAEDLNLGEGTTLTASGTYDTTGAVDDRQGVGFLDVQTEIPEGFPRYEGDPFDAAIYLASTGGDVDVSSEVSITSTSYEMGEYPNGNGEPGDYGEPVVSNVGAMVIDAYDTVTFDESGIEGGAFEDSLARGDVGDRLEVVSRITEWLFQAVGRLPYPNYPYYGGGPFPSDYTYVLRGAGLENPAIIDGRAWVLVDPDNAPLDREAGEKAEMQALGLDGCPVLLAAASTELGIPGDTIEVSMANSFALNTDIQACESCARLVNAAAILRDEDGSVMAAMNQVFNELAPANVAYTPEVAASIVTAFAGRVNDGTQYATVIEFIDALVNYIAVLDNDMGSPVGDSVAFVIEKYGKGITESENNNMAAFIAARLESGETFAK